MSIYSRPARAGAGVAALLVLVILAFAGEAQAAPGDLDPTFGGDGILTSALTPDTDDGREVVLQPDGKIVVAGYSMQPMGTFDFAVTRYMPDGALDPTFSGDGRQTTAIGSGNDLATSVALQADGKIVVAGSAQGATTDFALARYGSDGELDPTFSGDGKLIRAVGTGNDAAESVAVDAGGNIVAAGYGSGEGNGLDFAVARFETDGDPDNAFSGDGMTLSNNGPRASADYGGSVALQPDGNIVVAGYSSPAGPGQQPDFQLMRYESDGDLDPAFSGDGKQTTDFGAGADYGRSVVVQPDGDILVAGYATQGTLDFALARYEANGTPDATFSDDGRLTTAVGLGNDIAQAVALQADGRIVVGGYSAQGGTMDFAVARYDASGGLDPSFAGDGAVTTPIGTGNDYIHSMAIQPDGKIVTAGYADLGPENDLALARYGGAPPQTTIDAGPSGPTGDSTPTFAFSSDEPGAGFECRIDTATFTSCVSPLTTAALVDGVHTFEVRAVGAGNDPDQSPSARTFTVDTMAPDTQISSGPTGATGANDPAFGFFSPDVGATFECRLDGPGSAIGAYAACTSPRRYAGLAAGDYTVRVRATDATANIDSSAASRSFTVPACMGRAATKVVAAGSGPVKGTPGRDVIFGSAGADRIDGGGGDDVICANGGNDHVSGGAGNDRIAGSTGNDTAAGGTGRDSISGFDGNDRLSGGDGNDRMSGGTGSDRASGGAGADYISGYQGNDRLAGGDGNDQLSGNSGNDRIDGGAGSDRLFGRAGRDRLRVRDRRSDVADGGSGRDSVVADRVDRIRSGEAVSRR